MKMSPMDYSRHYLKWHSDAEAHYESMTGFYERTLSSLLPDDKDSYILDVGCGMGLLLCALKKFGYKKSVGIDVSKEQIAYCKKHDVNAVLVDDTITFLVDHKDSFDCIIALDLIEHIPTNAQLEFMCRLFESLKSSGMFLCTVPNANASLAFRWRYIDFTHASSFTEHSLDFLLYNSGFKDIQIYPMEFNTPPAKKYLLRPEVFRWWIYKSFRAFRRLEMVAELGRTQAMQIPLSLNILGVARKP
jgi:SAM-dependent methyltransferase